MTQWDKFQINESQGTVTPSASRTDVNSIEEEDPNKAIIQQFIFFGDVNSHNQEHNNSHNTMTDISNITIGELRKKAEALPDGEEKHTLMALIKSISENPTVASILGGISSATTSIALVG